SCVPQPRQAAEKGLPRPAPSLLSLPAEEKIQGKQPTFIPGAESEHGCNSYAINFSAPCQAWVAVSLAVKLQGQLDCQRRASTTHNIKPCHARRQCFHQLQAVLNGQASGLFLAQPR